MRLPNFGASGRGPAGPALATALLTADHYEKSLACNVDNNFWVFWHTLSHCAMSMDALKLDVLSFHAAECRKHNCITVALKKFKIDKNVN